MIDAREFGARVRRLRMAIGIDQAQLGKRAGIDQQGDISRIENGRARLTDDLVDALAGGLNCTAAFLTEPVEIVPSSRPWLRAYADAPKRTVDQQMAQCTLAAEAMVRLNLAPLPDSIPALHGVVEDDEDIDALAAEAREAAGIPEGAVVGHMVRAAEQLGCVVLPMAGELGRHLGLSTYANLHPMICVSRPTDESGEIIPGDRQRFTVAHELGHLALHRELPPPRNAAEARRIENEAHRFAGAFLAPGDAMLEELDDLGGRVTLSTLSQIKANWGVAIKALVIRFRQLGVIEDDQARSLYKQISARRWNKTEPVPVENEQAIWFTMAIERRHRGHSDPLGSAADTTGLGRTYFEQWTTWTGAPPAPSAPVIDLPTRPDPSRDPHEAGAATVASLAARRSAQSTGGF